MEYLNYQDKQIPCSVDFSTIKQFQKLYNIKLSEFETVVENLDMTEKLCQIAIKRGCQREGIDDMSAHAEDILCEANAEFLLIFNAALFKLFNVKDKKK
jgi:hypothetical protein